ncbi:MAG: toll/interleukin-1 receptor domain-containing protein [Chloroflexota bacterium]
MRIFISYALEDKDKVESLIIDNLPNYDCQEEVKDSDIFVYVVSENSIQSDKCQQELTNANDIGKPVILVLLESNVQLPFKLKNLPYVDFSVDETNNVVAQFIEKIENLNLKRKSEKAIEQEKNTEQTFIQKKSEKSHLTRVAEIIGIIGVIFTIGFSLYQILLPAYTTS